MSQPLQNDILNGLPRETIEALRSHLRLKALPQGAVLVRHDSPIQYLWFIRSGLASACALSILGRTVEVGVIGNEGFVGFQALLGQAQAPTLVLMQSAGSGWRLRVSVAEQLLLTDPEFLKLFHPFLGVYLSEVSQSVLCNRLHEAENRLARWLLMASDRLQSDELHLTQEFLAQMLGSTRSTVTIMAGTLQESGMIRYSRGKIRILDRAALERTACGCYALIKDLHNPAVLAKVGAVPHAEGDSIHISNVLRN